MATLLQVQAFSYPSVINLAPLNGGQIVNVAESIAATLGSSSLFRAFYVNPALFEQRNIQYSEKQVTRIDDNFYYYSKGIRFGQQALGQSPPSGINYLIRKSFSGDVSGDIGEALFAYFIVQEMGVAANSLAHTRPEKRRGLTPDFVVWDASHNLSTLLQAKNYMLPVLAEVKGFTGIIDPARISHALSQLRALGSNPSLFGLVFLAIRNEARRGYDVYIVRVKT
jgi:hypothetical protein